VTPQPGARVTRRTSLALCALGVLACDHAATSAPGAATSAPRAAQAPGASTVTLAGPGSYALAAPDQSPIATLTLPAGSAGTVGTLRAADSVALPARLRAVSPVVELALDARGLPVPATLFLRTERTPESEMPWALAIGAGGARRMPITGFVERDGVVHAELTAVDAARYVLVIPTAPDGCDGHAVAATDAHIDLSLTEVAGATYVRGNLRITGAAASQAELEALRCLVLLDGNLSLAPDADTDLTDLSALAQLTLIGGHLAVSHPRSLASASLPSLFVAGADLAIEHAQRVELPLLSHVAGGLGIGEGVAELDAPALQVVAKSLALVRSQLTSLDGLPALSAVGANLGIVHNDALIHADGLHALSLVGGSLLMAQNQQLESAQFPLLGELGRVTRAAAGTEPLIVADNPALNVSVFDGLAQLLGLAR